MNKNKIFKTLDDVGKVCAIFAMVVLVLVCVILFILIFCEVDWAVAFFSLSICITSLATNIKKVKEKGYIMLMVLLLSLIVFFAIFSVISELINNYDIFVARVISYICLVISIANEFYKTAKRINKE